MRKAQTSRLRSFFAPMTAFLLVALSLVFVGVASPASAFNDCGKDPGWTKVDQDSGSIDAVWGSLNWDADGSDNNTIAYTVEAGWTLELCIKASTADSYSQPIVGPETDEFSTGDKYGISHIGYKIGVTLPNQPTYDDPCGPGNATWNIPANTSAITWTLVGGELIATATAPYKFTDGTSVKNYGVAPDSGELCGQKEIEVPAEPSVTDPCGAGNATWNVPGDTEVFEWDVEDGDLVVTILTPNTVFEGTDDTSYNFGKAPETNTDPCVEEIEVPAEPSVTDPCGAGNATWNLPEDSDVFAWDVVDGDLVVTILTPNTVFEENGKSSYNFGEAVETNTEECEVEQEELELPAEPDVSDPCGLGNAEWIVPGDTEVFDWELVDGELIVTILAENTVFEGTDDTSYNFGEAVETNTEECEVLGEQLEIPAQPAVKDPCGTGNARWVVPADTDTLDWSLTDGVLSVEITAPDTVFEGTEDTTYSFGKAVETNKDACEVKGDQDNPPMTVEVKGEQATVVPTSVDAGLPGLAENHPQGTTRNPLWLLAIGSGLGLLGIAGSRRRRTATR